MKTIFSFGKQNYLKMGAIFLVAVMLIVGVVSCEGEGETEYDLTMAVSPAGSGTATDLTGSSPYAEGATVIIQADPASGYLFVSWSAPAGTLSDPNAATTTFTMPDQDVTVTANFELPAPPDNFKFYQVDDGTAPSIDQQVQLTDQFGTFNVIVRDAVSFGNPVEGPGMPINDENRHYTVYLLDYDFEADSIRRYVTYSNLLDEEVMVIVEGPVALAVPTQKEGHGDPGPINHFLLYQVRPFPTFKCYPSTPAIPGDIDVDLMDQFDTYLDWGIGSTERFWNYCDEQWWFPEVNLNAKDQFIPAGEDVTFKEPVGFANPVKKIVVATGEVTDIEDANEHWVLYDILEDVPQSIERTIEIDNQFGEQTLDLTFRDFLAVSSEKDDWDVDDPVPASWDFSLDDHLAEYSISSNDPEWEPGQWAVNISNQFGQQLLLVEGPYLLAVPAWKLSPGDHGPPENLDHYLIYSAEGLELDVRHVDLDDEFPGAAVDVTVFRPCAFGIPVEKTHGGVTPILNPDIHLVLYEITWGDGSTQPVTFEDQFISEEIQLLLQYELLAVPSVKTGWIYLGTAPP